jgi:hypothetical protein
LILIVIADDMTIIMSRALAPTTLAAERSGCVTVMGIRPNLQVKTGGATYGQPKIWEVLDL